MSSSDVNKERFLSLRGWKQDPQRTIWQWYIPQIKVRCYYTLKDAYDVAVGLERQSQSVRIS